MTEFTAILMPTYNHLNSFRLSITKEEVIFFFAKIIDNPYGSVLSLFLYYLMIIATYQSKEGCKEYRRIKKETLTESSESLIWEV